MFDADVIGITQVDKQDLKSVTQVFEEQSYLARCRVLK